MGIINCLPRLTHKTLCVSTEHFSPLSTVLQIAFSFQDFFVLNVQHTLLEVYILDKGKDDSDGGIYTLRIWHTS